MESWKTCFLGLVLGQIPGCFNVDFSNSTIFVGMNSQVLQLVRFITQNGKKFPVMPGNIVFSDVQGNFSQANPESIVTQTFVGDPNQIDKTRFNAFLKKHNQATKGIVLEKGKLRARVVDPDKFKEGSFRTFTTPELPSGVVRVGGKLKTP